MKMIHTSNTMLRLLWCSSLICFASQSPAQAQDNPIISQEQAERLQSEIQIEIADEILTEAAEDETATTLQPQADEYSVEPEVPALVDIRDNTNFTVGVLASSDDENEGRYRDPFDVDNNEISPIYPEGIYVDYMRTDAGVNLTSKF